MYVFIYVFPAQADTDVDGRQTVSGDFWRSLQEQNKPPVGFRGKPLSPVCSRRFPQKTGARPRTQALGRRDNMVGNPHRAQISEFELFELKFINWSFSSFILVEIRQTVPCRAIRGKSSDSRQQYLSPQYSPPS